MRIMLWMALAVLGVGCRHIPESDQHVLARLEGQLTAHGTLLAEVDTNVGRLLATTLDTSCRSATVFVKDVPAHDGAAHYKVVMPSISGLGLRQFDVYARPGSPPTGIADSILSNITSGAQGFFQVVSGWAYFFGQAPTAKTSWVTAGSDSTKFVLQLDDSVHRVYLLPGAAGDSIDLTSHSGVTKRITLPIGSSRLFVEVNQYGSISDILNLDDNAYSAQKQFIDNVVRPEVMAAGITW